MQTTHLRALLVAAAVGLFSTSVSLDADADVSRSSTPQHIAQARKLNHDARRLDARAERHQRAAQRKADEAERQRDRARQLRQRRGDARLEARADDLEVAAAIAVAAAKHERQQALKVRAIAKRLRGQAKRVARTPSAARRKGDTAKLSVASRELCRLAVDGIDRGFTPVSALQLAPGRHRISCATLEGETLRRTVHVRARTTQRITLSPKGVRDPFSETEP